MTGFNHDFSKGATYSDGTKAAIGDIVIGKGMNVPHEIQGVVIDIDDGQTTDWRTQPNTGYHSDGADFHGSDEGFRIQVIHKTVVQYQLNDKPGPSVTPVDNVEYGLSWKFRKVGPFRPEQESK